MSNLAMIGPAKPFKISQSSIKTCGVAQKTLVPASPLRGLEALKVVIGLHERVHRRRRCRCAIGPPLCVFLLSCWPECRAHRVSGEAPNTPLVDAVQIHAPLR